MARLFVTPCCPVPAPLPAAGPAPPGPQPAAAAPPPGGSLARRLAALPSGTRLHLFAESLPDDGLAVTLFSVDGSTLTSALRQPVGPLRPGALLLTAIPALTAIAID